MLALTHVGLNSYKATDGRRHLQWETPCLIFGCKQETIDIDNLFGVCGYVSSTTLECILTLESLHVLELKLNMI